MQMTSEQIMQEAKACYDTKVAQARSMTLAEKFLQVPTCLKKPAVGR